ncbi:D-aminoacyl-tRNA deacylase [Alicyclobacillus sp. SO9]|uniref:D-aminoacyl-tRNA deacylase n=1 Tax=Alicyclobacillus sp. SO9 TaxID=2665646 RepID=UPI0018E85C4C|nr:D-aminoacyl-tRNA deacylase [Alicyclobacillus sp. SO9]QQE77448.1 D-tyrosyl-tRNA(Tyr) deacylase [Alicyclobacillus sp. SO9]
MRVVIQRCTRAAVRSGGEEVGAIGRGFMLLVGFSHGDAEKDLKYIADKIVNLRVFEDADGKMNLSLLEVRGEILSISQFTLYGDVRKGRRPNFMDAAPPEHAEALYHEFNGLLRDRGPRVATGVFGAMMEVDFVNDGPVTLLLDSQRNF